jgi:hypothetical protein
MGALAWYREWKARFRIGGRTSGIIVSRSHASQGEMRTAASFLIQSQRVDILASNVAEQQRRVCGVQPHIPSKPSGVVPIL